MDGVQHPQSRHNLRTMCHVSIMVMIIDSVRVVNLMGWETFTESLDFGVIPWQTRD